MKTKFSNKEYIDSGLAFVLLLLLASLFWHSKLAIKIDVFCVLIVMVKPSIFYPFAFIWLNLSDLLGKIVSSIILGIIFWIFVVPTGLVRKLSGKDNLKLKQFHKSNNSVFTERNHEFSKDDMLNPY